MARRQQKIWLVESEDENFEDFSDTSNTDYSDKESQNSDSDDKSDRLFNSDEESLFESKTPLFFLGEDKQTKRSMGFPNVEKIQNGNIVSEIPGVKPLAKEAKTPIEAWRLFFTDETLQRIVEHTNKKLRSLQRNYQRVRSCTETDIVEVKALLGLLYFAGTLGLSHTSTKDLWATDGTAPPYFRCVMSESRFCLLLRALRFDDATTRESRKKLDKLAKIRELWDNMVQKFLKMYCPGEHVTLVEMMFAFRGKCSFRQDLSWNRYGLKTFALVDSKTHYCLNMEIDTKKEPAKFHTKDNKPREVKRLAKTFLNTGRNLIMDNGFSSIPLVDELKDNHPTSAVTMLGKIKKEIDAESDVNSSLLGYNNELVSNVPKKHKTVQLESSMHTSDAIDSNSTKEIKREVISFYNSTKRRLDTVDQLRGKYSVARSSSKWSLTLFFAILDIVGINSQIIYSENTDKTLRRKEYLKIIAKDLTTPWMLERLMVPNLTIDVRNSIKKFTGTTDTKENSSGQERGLCFYCPAKKNRKTKVKCLSCLHSICGEHTRPICANCFADHDSAED